ncbi:hypothetical protein BJB45_19370 [Halomonas huangheensis]|uniref:Uncharacterized protein n=1 Tax=Halomonas huangheensis TaxID=1178482 RepID=W1N5F7_9GAMM|nr:hypothetical protein BJB45_19370 [Halomonas huangheensis]
MADSTSYIIQITAKDNIALAEPMRYPTLVDGHNLPPPTMVVLAYKDHMYY